MSCPKPNHHPTQECLLAYANGGMGEAESLLLATHLAFCPECRKLTAIGECVGSKVLEDTAAVPVSNSCRDKLFAALDSAGCADAPALTMATPECFVPEPLRGYLGGAGCRTGVQQLAWQRINDGQKEFKITLTSCCQRRGADARLIALVPNAGLILPPTSCHRALLVLCGQMLQNDTQFKAGDLLCGAHTDSMRAGTEPCIALLVTTRPVAGWLQKFLRLIKH